VVTLDVAGWIAEYVNENCNSGNETVEAILKVLGKASGSRLVEADVSKLRGMLELSSSLDDLTRRDTEGVKLATRTGGAVSSEDELLSTEAGKFGTDSTLLTGSKTGSTYEVFSKTGILVAFREITAGDMTTLRMGGQLNMKETVIRFNLRTAEGSIALNARVKFEDYTKAEGTVFFGDRPLANPGYSALHWQGM
jgi:hypothetical protein